MNDSIEKLEDVGEFRAGTWVEPQEWMKLDTEKIVKKLRTLDFSVNLRLKTLNMLGALAARLFLQEGDTVVIQQRSGQMFVRIYAKGPPR